MTQGSTMHRLITLVAVLVLAGCAGGDRVVSSNPHNVVIVREGTVESATAAASQQCALYGKYSRLASQQGMTMSFDCVGP